VDDFEVVPNGPGEFLIRANSDYDTQPVTFSLTLDEAESVSDGRLAEDERTARATIRFLLEHQDAAELPEQMQIPDIVLAYPDAVERIVALLD
jgi:hypothetical protein